MSKNLIKPVEQILFWSKEVFKTLEANGLDLGRDTRQA